MADIFCGVIDFVTEQVSGLPSIEENLGVVGKILNWISYMFNWITSANFLIPIPDIFLILSCIFIMKTFHILVFAANWVIRRIFDVIP